ncbi:MAG TPA: protein kinase [Oligoflexia bacterium]|nr:protein kinase [Oligoflexia bacterium]
MPTAMLPSKPQRRPNDWATEPTSQLPTLVGSELLLKQFPDPKKYLKFDFKQNQKILGRFQIEDLLGEGKFAKVYLVANLKPRRLDCGSALYEPEIAAIKFFKITSDQQENEKLFERWRNEWDILEKVNKPVPGGGPNPYVPLPYRHNLINAKTPEEKLRLPYILMEAINGIDLDGAMFLYKDKNKQPTERVIARLGWMLSRCCLLLLKNGVLHRDIKPQNIMLDLAELKSTPDRGLYLVDFGGAEDLNIMNIKKRFQFAGTPYFMAPEQLIKERFDANEKTEVYAIGMTIAIMMGLNLLPDLPDRKDSSYTDDWLTKLRTEKLKIDFSLRLRSNYSDTLKNIVRKTLDPNPEGRPSLQELVVSLYILNRREKLKVRTGVINRKDLK